MISVSGVYKSYYRHLPHQKDVLKGVDLEIASGETQFLLGGNGAGKTTLLRAISTLLPQDAGSITVNGFDASSAPDMVKRSIGFFSVNTALYERLTGFEFLQYFAGLYDLPHERFIARLDEINRIFDLESCLKLDCSAMSSGQKQKCNIARAVLHDPPVYIMDEPTTGLDVESISGILDFILYQRSQKKTLLIVTHNMEMVHKLGGRVAFLINGKIPYNLTVDEMIDQSGKTNLIDAYRFYADGKYSQNTQHCP